MVAGSRALSAAVSLAVATEGRQLPPWTELDYYWTVSFINSVVSSESKTGACGGGSGGYDRALLGLASPGQ